MSRSSDLNFWSRSIFGIAIFTSAFLLFQVQLILGKFLLPWFGGTSAVWTTCLLFFQVLLFGGYLYSHKLSELSSLSSQTALHLVFLLLASSFILIGWRLWGSPLLPDGG